MKRIYLLIIFCFSITGLKSQVIDDRTNIIIDYEVSGETFPKSWKTKTINTKGISLDSVELERSLNIIKKALGKYPLNILKNNLKKIYILKSIEFYGQNFGGTNSTDIVYIANNGVDNGYTDYYIEETFHHEFSSILLRNYPYYFDKKAWQSVNQLDYRKGGVQALKNSKDDQNIDSALNVNGFLHQYATSSLENDFNSFAENLFVPSTNKFYETVKLHTGLSKKLYLAIEFYHSLDKIFTEKYFKTFIEK